MTEAVARLPAYVRGLLQPTAYEHAADDIQLRETHVSWVILVGDYAYKLKKPVKLGFVDFSTFERRAANCEAEVRLNQRLAPSVYFGAVDVVERDGAFHVGGPGRVVERAVWMRRLPTEGMLSNLLARDAVSPSLVRRIARMIARFHSTAPTGKDVNQHGALENIRDHWTGNFEQIAPYVDVTIPSFELAAIRQYVERVLDVDRNLLTERVHQGHIRDGHGDLHADSICLVDGEIVAFDCLEFADSYRCGDVAAEVGFLAMDLDHAGRADLAWRFVSEYVRASGDEDLPRLLDFYKCYRAFVRGKVLSLRLAEEGLANDERSRITKLARSYFDLALAYAGGVPRPLLLVTAGLPGTGKTTLARELARRLGMVHISTDVVRKQLAGVDPTDHSAANSDVDLYSAEMTRRTYAAVRARGAQWLRRGVSVVLDGTFTDERQRELVRRLAARTNASFLMAVTTAGDDVVRQRLQARESDPTNVSDATWPVYDELRKRHASLAEPSEDVFVDETGGSGADAVIELLAMRASAEDERVQVNCKDVEVQATRTARDPAPPVKPRTDGGTPMRGGFKVFDADTHMRPSAESISPYLDPSVRQRIPDLDDHRVEIKVGMAGEVRTEPYRHWFRFSRGEGWSSSAARVLGEAAPREGKEREFQTFMGTILPTEGAGDYDVEARIRDMDAEGTDVHFIVQTAGAGHKDPSLEFEFIKAQHRYMNDFCGAHPHRLKTCLNVTPRSVDESVAEIKRWGPEPWCVAILPQLPLDFPIDHPDMNPIWAAAADEGLAVVHHSFSMGYPGYRDLWSNPFLGRLAGHPWSGMRATAAFVGGGIMDRFPTIRFGVLECGFGWLPFWAARMDDQAIYMGHVAENLEYKLSEYLTGGRFFAGIVIHEGEEMAAMVTEMMGDHILMMGSDYPHSESRFPRSVDEVVGWTSLSEEQRRKLLWDNPVAFFGEP